MERKHNIIFTFARCSVALSTRLTCVRLAAGILAVGNVCYPRHVNTLVAFDESFGGRGQSKDDADDKE